MSCKVFIREQCSRSFNWYCVFVIEHVVVNVGFTIVHKLRAKRHNVCHNLSFVHNKGMHLLLCHSWEQKLIETPLPLWDVSYDETMVIILCNITSNYFPIFWLYYYIVRNNFEIMIQIRFISKNILFNFIRFFCHLFYLYVSNEVIVI